MASTVSFDSAVAPHPLAPDPAVASPAAMAVDGASPDVNYTGDLNEYLQAGLPFQLNSSL